MNPKTASIGGLIFIFISQLFLSFGYDFLMSQRPIDFAHWAMLLGALLLFSLWFSLPANATKKIGLIIMTLGIAGVIGMCTIDFFLWAAHEEVDLKQKLFDLIKNTPSLQHPFLTVGPGLFYMGMSIATYGLFKRYKWQVLLLNIGALMIGLGHMVFGNRIVPVFGAALLLVGLTSIIFSER